MSCCKVKLAVKTIVIVMIKKRNYLYDYNSFNKTRQIMFNAVYLFIYFFSSSHCCKLVYYFVMEFM